MYIFGLFIIIWLIRNITGTLSSKSITQASIFLFITIIISYSSSLLNNNGSNTIFCGAAPFPSSSSSSSSSSSLSSSLSPLSSPTFSSSSMITPIRTLESPPTVASLAAKKISTSIKSLDTIIIVDEKVNNSVTPQPFLSMEQMALKRVADIQRVDNLTRQHSGDIFNAYDVQRCEMDTCIGLSSGTAELFVNDKIDHGKRYKANVNDCRCQCLPHLNTFREDLNICVDDIHECTLAPFVSGSSSERIPFVFLPLRGQIIHPSKEISFQGVTAPVCAVSGSQYLTTTGWTDLRNPIDTDVPFRLFRDEGRTFLQWLGEADLRYKMQGRIILVHLMCRDMAPNTQMDNIEENYQSSTDSLDTNFGTTKSKNNIFSPCVAFRVVGTPIKHINNVTEVSFQSETHATSATSIVGLTTKEYIAIGICSVLLGLIYVASVFLYLHVKKRKTRTTEQNELSSNENIDVLKNDQVTFGTGFSRNGSVVSTYGGKIHSSIGGSSIGGSRRDTNRLQQSSINGASSNSVNGINGEELGIVKNNPLLKHYPMGDNSGFISDLSNSNSECDDDHHGIDTTSGMLLKSMQQSFLLMNGPGGMNQSLLDRSFGFDSTNDSENQQLQQLQLQQQETECIPQENVSIVEDMSSEDKLENMKAIVNGTMRRKLYFNPAYFEPHLLLTPPAAAIEFLNKIREVITIAKYKMSAKRYQPSLIMIPEEHSNHFGSDTYASQIASRHNSSIISQSNNNNNQNSNNNRRKSLSSCAGCPGCSDENNKSNNTNNNNTNCKNCGDKRNSIRKWLEEVSTHENERLSDPDNEHNILDKDNPTADKPHDRIGKKLSIESGSSSDSDTIKANSLGSKGSTKRKAPPIPTTNPPKIISHFLKKLSSSSSPSSVENPNHHHDHQQDTIDSKLTELNNRRNGKNITQPPPIQSKIYEKMELYNKVTKSGGDLFNNPQFQHNSPQLSHRSQSSVKGRSPKPHIEVLDQFSNPSRSHYEVMKNLHQMPDMVYEAMAKDYTKHKFENNYGQINMPTPDYDDGTIGKKKYEDVPPYVHVPTPDYNTYGRSKAHPPPDSPIYTRKSPHHLIVDYETDSLERSTTTKGAGIIAASSLNSRRSATATPPSNSSDLSSQPSPSLSVALPLEEVLEVRNTVYDRVEGFRKDSNDINRIPQPLVPLLSSSPLSSPSPTPSSLAIKQLLPKSPNIEANLYEDMTNNFVKPLLPPKEPRIKYNTPSQGSMTIEVEHSPSDCDNSTDSEQFEPDTLDRKPKKLNGSNVPPLSTQSSINNGGQKNINAWSQHMKKSENFLNESDEKVNYSSLENMTSLPDMNYLQNTINSQLVLRSSGSFKSNSLNNFSDINSLINDQTLQKSFNSLREIYEAKNQKNLPTVQRNLNTPLTAEEKGRLLTLEARHSKRQRQTNASLTLKKPKPPDVVPAENNTAISGAVNATSTITTANDIYDNPKLPTRRVIVDGSHTHKNLTGWSTDDNSTISDEHNNSNSNNNNMMIIANASTTDDTSSEHDDGTLGANSSSSSSSSSESTEITGVSDTQINSEFESEHQRQRLDTKKPIMTSMCESTIDRSYSKVQKVPKFQINSGSGRKKHSTLIKDDDQSLEILENFMTLGDIRNKHLIDQDQSDMSDTSTLKSGSTNFFYTRTNSISESMKNQQQQQKLLEDIDKIEIISSKSVSNHNVPILNNNNNNNNTNSMNSTNHNNNSITSNKNNNETASCNSIMQELTLNTTHFELNPASRMPTKVFRVDVNPSSHGMQIALGLKDRVKKSKDLKYAWKKFVNIATSKFQGNSSSGGSSGPKSSESNRTDLDGLEKSSILSDGDDGISSMHDESLMIKEDCTNASGSGLGDSGRNSGSRNSGDGGCSSSSGGLISRTPSSTSDQSRGTRLTRSDLDSGYMSADSNESKIHNKKLYERFNFKASKSSTFQTTEQNSKDNENDFAQRNMNRMQEIKETTESSTTTSVSSRKSSPTNTLSAAVCQKPSVTGFIPKQSFMLHMPDPLKINVYSSDEERYSSEISSESDEEYNLEDMCESGAESVETSSVFFKNIRKSNNGSSTTNTNSNSRENSKK